MPAMVFAYTYDTLVASSSASTRPWPCSHMRLLLLLLPCNFALRCCALCSVVHCSDLHVVLRVGMRFPSVVCVSGRVYGHGTSSYGAVLEQCCSAVLQSSDAQALHNHTRSFSATQVLVRTYTLTTVMTCTKAVQPLPRLWSAVLTTCGALGFCVSRTKPGAR